MSYFKLLVSSILFTFIFFTNVNAVDTSQQEAFIERFYQNILNRSADNGGMNTWLEVIQNQSATQVAMGFLNSQEFKNLNLSNEEFLDIMYQTMFNRTADSGGKSSWLEKMNNGRTKQSVMFGFFQSQEFKNLTDSFGVRQILESDRPSLTGVESYVDRFYRLVLKRNYDEGGFNDWVSQLTNKTKNPIEIASGFLFSPEYINQNEDNSTFLDTCYQAFFGRAADAGGKAGWLAQLQNGATKQQIFDGFTGSLEFANLVDSFNLDADTTPPVFTSLNTITVDENQTSVITITTTDASAVRYMISGIDKDSFNINQTSGVLTFKIAPDYETKSSYSINIRAIDSLANISVQNLLITINNIEEGPIFISPNNVTVAENQITVLTTKAINGGIFQYSLSGTDSTLFNINSAKGDVTFKDIPDYETKNTYNITIHANDNLSNSLSQNMTIKIRDLDESISHNGIAYESIISPITGKVWLDRNLGATEICSKSPEDFSSDDDYIADQKNCFGNYFQWGRLADAHEFNLITTLNKATEIDNAGALFIRSQEAPYDWVKTTTLDSSNVDDNGNLRETQWTKTDGSTICPKGFRVPSINELKDETINYSGINNQITNAIKVINRDTAFNNFLRLPTSGLTAVHTGVKANMFAGYLWSSTPEGTASAPLIYLQDQIVEGFQNRGTGMPVRCIQNDDTNAPIFISNDTISVDENQTQVISLEVKDDNSVYYTLSGVDSTNFNLNSLSGIITFKKPPNYEVKSSYEIEVTATDIFKNSSTQNITININNLEESLNKMTLFKQTNNTNLQIPIAKTNINNQKINIFGTISNGNKKPTSIHMLNETSNTVHVVSLDEENQPSLFYSYDNLTKEIKPYFLKIVKYNNYINIETYKINSSNTKSILIESKNLTLDSNGTLIEYTNTSQNIRTSYLLNFNSFASEAVIRRVIQVLVVGGLAIEAPLLAIPAATYFAYTEREFIGKRLNTFFDHVIELIIPTSAASDQIPVEIEEESTPDIDMTAINEKMKEIEEKMLESARYLYRIKFEPISLSTTSVSYLKNFSIQSDYIPQGWSNGVIGTSRKRDSTTGELLDSIYLRTSFETDGEPFTFEDEEYNIVFYNTEFEPLITLSSEPFAFYQRDLTVEFIQSIQFYAIFWNEDRLENFD